MSPYRFGSAITSYSSGRETSWLQRLSMIRSSNSIWMALGHRARGLEEEAVGELHDVRLCAAVTPRLPFRSAYENAGLDDPIGSLHRDRLDRDPWRLSRTGASCWARNSRSSSFSLVPRSNSIPA